MSYLRFGLGKFGIGPYVRGSEFSSQPDSSLGTWAKQPDSITESWTKQTDPNVETWTIYKQV
jgi:hypothetical protein